MSDHLETHITSETILLPAIKAWEYYLQDQAVHASH
jgi:hypothetical protein